MHFQTTLKNNYYLNPKHYLSALSIGKSQTEKGKKKLRGTMRLASYTPQLMVQNCGEFSSFAYFSIEILVVNAYK